MIVNSNLTSADEITHLHYSSEVAGILGRLRPNRLREDFYVPLLSDPQIKSIQSLDNLEEIQGFLAFRNAANIRPLTLPIKNLKLILDTLRVILTTPTYISVVLNVLWTERKTSKTLKLNGLQYGEIQILIVRKDVQGRGVGSELLNNLIQNSAWSNIIVKTQSEKAKSFYLKNGFVQILQSNFMNSTIFVLMIRNELNSGN